MDRDRKLQLIERSLGLKHKLKVHESVKPPETHEEMSAMLLAKWELEDELKAIEDLLVLDRARNVTMKRSQIEKEGAGKKKGKKEPSRLSSP